MTRQRYEHKIFSRVYPDDISQTILSVKPPPVAQFWVMGASQFLIVAILNCFLPSIHAAVSSTGFTVSLEDVSYFLPPGSVATVSVVDELKVSFENNGPLVPITVIESTEQSTEEISSITAKYLAQDDVFQLGFLEGT